MTQTALRRYCTDTRPCTEHDYEASPGPICLYACKGYRISGLTMEVSKADDGTLSVYVEVQAVQAGGAPTTDLPYSAYEGLTLGPGVPVGSTVRRPLVIADASTSA